MVRQSIILNAIACLDDNSLSNFRGGNPNMTYQYDPNPHGNFMNNNGGGYQNNSMMMNNNASQMMFME